MTNEPVIKSCKDEPVDTITTKQLQVLLQVGEENAKKIMASIKGVSDTLRIKGICHKQDYEIWLENRKSGNRK